MQSTALISVSTVSPSIIRIRRDAIHRKPNRQFEKSWKTQESPFACNCKASNSSCPSSITDIDLYELFGIDSTCNQAQIKLAYRGLQKRCHPDIAGPAGHHMAIILNEAYAVLSDPASRLAYDKDQAKIEDLHGYTGKPIYSVWLGSENETRAVFVDEVKCVGCLKCALFAEKTFAVESVYGRARVVAQWADPEEKIQASIETCPVDCISVVERSNLAALEFLMSKQPRGNVRIGIGNTVGACASDIFADLEKFQARYAMTKASSRNSKESNVQRELWISAIQGIRSVSNWLYWQAQSAEATNQNLTHFRQKATRDPDIERIRKISEARKQARETIHCYERNPSNCLPHDEYWTPPSHVLPEYHVIDSGSNTIPKSSPTKVAEVFEENFPFSTERRSDPFSRFAPMGFSAVAAFTIRLQQGEGAAKGLEDHIAGSLVKDIVNSSFLQVILAGLTWYLIGLYVVEVVRAVQISIGKDRE